MSEMTYTCCPVCQGSLRMSMGPDVPLSAIQQVPCPCTRGDTPGWAPTGVTLAQMDRMAETERALAGDPGVPESRRREVLARALARVALGREGTGHE